METINYFFHKTDKKLMAFIIFLALALTMCNTQKPTVTRRNVSFLYNPSTTSLHPEFFLMRKNDTTSLLYVKINTEDLFFLNQIGETTGKAHIMIHYELHPSFDKQQLLDSSSRVYVLTQNEEKKSFIAYLPVKTKDSSECMMEVKVTDLQKLKTSTAFLTVLKRNTENSQNYMVCNTNYKIPFFKNYFYTNEKLTIQYRGKNITHAVVEYYSHDFESPAPPFSLATGESINIKPDSIWSFPEKDSLVFELKYEGMYFFRTDSTQKEGLTLYNFGSNYPFLKTPHDLLKPLRYLNTKKSYMEMEMYASKKTAVDNFWLEIAGDAERAKELIRIYYSRSLFANHYFSCHTEGWNTDRGMIYIIFGAPSIIYKSEKGESWIYGELSSGMIFNFEKKRNRFSENAYELLRNESFKDIWYQAIDTWRNGRIFSIVTTKK